MKKIIMLIVMFCASNIFAQIPQKMNYQAVIRDASNKLITNQTVGIRVSILQGSSTGTEIYKEIYNPNPRTNGNGLIMLEIGVGVSIKGKFSDIDWSKGQYFIKTETDPNGGSNYSIIGSSELTSVPYALFSANGVAGPKGDVGPAGPQGATGPQGQKGDTGLQGATGGYTIHTIGENYGGGKVFYVYDNGQHGLIAALADQSASMRWYGGTYTNTCALADGVGAGMKNTAIIIANQGPIDGVTFAARLCNEYSVTDAGVTYGDWYLPSKFELNLMYLQKSIIGGFALGNYWSSTESDSNIAWRQFFTNGNQYNINFKNSLYNVRAIRAF
jgi:hypothetical protein